MTSDRSIPETLRSGISVLYVSHDPAMTGVLRPDGNLFLEPVGPDTELQRGDLVLFASANRTKLRIAREIDGAFILLMDANGKTENWILRDAILGKAKSSHEKRQTEPRTGT